MSAQRCIQSALALRDGFKILHRGKVIYPYTSSKSNDTKKSSPSSSRHQQQQASQPINSKKDDDTVVDDDELTISEKILQLSQQVGETLIVMGTLQGRELKDPPPPSSSSTTAATTPSSTISRTQGLRLLLIQWPATLIYHGTVSIWLFFKSFVLPPSSLTNGERRRDHSE